MKVERPDDLIECAFGGAVGVPAPSVVVGDGAYARGDVHPFRERRARRGGGAGRRQEPAEVLDEEQVRDDVDVVRPSS